MKKIILTVTTLLIFGSTKAQTIGDHLDRIKAINSNGEFVNTVNNYSYTYIDPNDNLFVYSLDNNLICENIVIKLNSDKAIQSWIQMLNTVWTPVEENIWSYQREDSVMIGTKMMTVEDEDIGTIFVIGYYK